jgi:hypothetical protein
MSNSRGLDHLMEQNSTELEFLSTYGSSSVSPIVIDIETANLGPSSTGVVNPLDWKISCVGVYDSLSNKKYIFIPFADILSFTDSLEHNLGLFIALQTSLLKATTADYILPLYPSIYSPGSLESTLNHWASEGRYFLTHRGLTFDWPILSHYLGIKDLYNWLNHKGRLLDTHAYIEQQTGYNCGLNALITACLGPDNGKTLKGSDAPKLWCQGVMDYSVNLSPELLGIVIDYCLGDVVKTHGVFDYGLYHEIIQVIPYGVENKVSVPIASWGMNL